MAPPSWVLITIPPAYQAPTGSALLTYLLTPSFSLKQPGRQVLSSPHSRQWHWDSETLSGMANITQPVGARAGSQALVCDHPRPTFHSPTTMDPAFLKSKLSPSPSRSFLPLSLHATSHLGLDTQITLNFSQFLKPSVLSLATWCLQVLFLLPEIVTSLSLPG